MQEPYLTIAITSLVLGIIAGVVMYRADFCITGMFRDVFLFRDTSMLHMLILLIAFSMILFEVSRLAGLLKYYPFPLMGKPSLANLLGGMLFGFGMVLAGGCVVGTLYKMGGGSMISLTALIGFLVGSVVYAEFHPAWAILAKSTQFTDGKITIPQLLGMSPSIILFSVAAVLLFYLFLIRDRKKLQRPVYAESYLQPWKAALILSIIGLASYLVVGMPLGITTSYAKLGSAIESLFIPAHVESLAYFQALPLKYAPPFSSVTITGGAGPALDAVAAIQYPLVGGIALGAMLISLKLGEFKFHFRVPAVQYVSAISGGIIVGLASRMSGGCNIWHLWGGVPILSVTSLLFLLGLIPGTWLGSKVLKKVVMKI